VGFTSIRGSLILGFAEPEGLFRAVGRGVGWDEEVTMGRLFWVVVIGVVLGATGCDQGPCDCRSEKWDVNEELGSPSSVDTYEEEGYFAETWTYSDLGRVYMFESGDLVCCCCDYSVWEI